MRRHRGVRLVIFGVALPCCASEAAIAPHSTPPKVSAPSDARVADSPRPEPGATHGAGSLLPHPILPDASVDAVTEDFHEQVGTALRIAQASVYKLQESDTLERPASRYGSGPDVFPSPGWSKFFADQAVLVHETAARLRETAQFAPDPDEFAALIDPWESMAADRLESLARAVGLSDDGKEYRKVMSDRGISVPASTTQPNADSLRQYLIALPGYDGPVTIVFGPDAGR